MSVQFRSSPLIIKMQNSLKLDYINRLKLQQIEIYKFILKFFCLNIKLPYLLRLYSFFLLNKLSKNSSKVRNQYNCLITSRKNGVYFFFAISRIMLKKLGSSQKIPGLRKYSW